MKKIKYIIATVFVVAIGVGIFLACQKENINDSTTVPEKAIKKNIPTESDMHEIDQMSEELANFHDFCVNHYINEIGMDNTVHPAIYDNMNSFVMSDLSNYPSLYDPNPQFLDYDTFLEYLNNPSLANCLNTIQSDLGEYIYDAELIEQCCEYIENHTEDLIVNSNSYEEFKDSYDQMVNSIIPLNNHYNYAFVRIFADMFASSCITWANYYYYEEPGVVALCQKEGSVWDKVKNAASTTWGNIKPTACADAEGAVKGIAGKIITVAIATTVATGGSTVPVTSTVIVTAAAVGSVVNSLYHVITHWN